MNLFSDRPLGCAKTHSPEQERGVVTVKSYINLNYLVECKSQPAAVAVPYSFKLHASHQHYYHYYCILWGTGVAQWLRCCATNRKVAGSIPAGVSRFFIDIKSF